MKSGKCQVFQISLIIQQIVALVIGSFGEWVSGRLGGGLVVRGFNKTQEKHFWGSDFGSEL